MSMVFQHFALLPHKSVVENVEFGLKLRGTPAAERRRKAEEVLAIVGLEKWADYRAEQSQRRHAPARRPRARARDRCRPPDHGRGVQRARSADPQRDAGRAAARCRSMLHKTILFITHDFQEALKLGTRIAILSDGAVVREGTPQEIVLESAQRLCRGVHPRRRPRAAVRRRLGDDSGRADRDRRRWRAFAAVAPRPAAAPSWSTATGVSSARSRPPTPLRCAARTLPRSDLRKLRFRRRRS